MAERIAADKDERVRNQLKKDFALTVTLGVADLSTFLVASEPMLDQALDKAIITSADATEPWQYLPDYSLLVLDRPTFGMVYFTVKNGSLLCTDTTGALSTLTTSATCSCGYVPLAATLSGNANLEELTIAMLADLAAMGEMNVPAAA